MVLLTRGGNWQLNFVANPWCYQTIWLTEDKGVLQVLHTMYQPGVNRLQHTVGTSRDKGNMELQVLQGLLQVLQGVLQVLHTMCQPGVNRLQQQQHTVGTSRDKGNMELITVITLSFTICGEISLSERNQCWFPACV